MTEATQEFTIVQGVLWGEYFVASRTTAGAFWRTTVGTTPTCTCPAGAHNFERCSRGACAHVFAVQQHHEAYTHGQVA